MNTSKAKHFIVFGIILATILVIGYLIKSKPQAPTKPEQETAWTVNVTPLEFVNRSPELNVIGRVESTQKTLITSRVTTTVEDTPVLSGHFVRKGDTILRLDPGEVEVTLIQRQADVRELEALISEEKLRHQANLDSLKTEQNLVKLAEKALARQKRLVKNNVTSEERLDNAEVSLQQQRLTVTNRQLTVKNHSNRLIQLTARLDRARAQLSLAELDIKQTALKAPFDSWVVSVRVATGNRVRIGDPLIELVAADSLEIRAQIPDRWVPQIHQILHRNKEDNVQPSAYTDLFGERTELRLDRLSASASDNTGGIDAFFQPAKGASLILDKSVSMNVRLPAVSNVFTLPVSSVYGFDRVYTVDEDSRLQAVRINRIGRFQDNNDAEWLIVSSEKLAPGKSVITTQLPNAVSGLKVKIRE